MKLLLIILTLGATAAAKIITDFDTGSLIPAGSFDAIKTTFKQAGDFLRELEHPWLMLGLLLITGYTIYRLLKIIVIVGVLIVLLVLLTNGLPEAIKNLL